jgi:hypothetical protein
MEETMPCLRTVFALSWLISFCTVAAAQQTGIAVTEEQMRKFAETDVSAMSVIGSAPPVWTVGGRYLRWEPPVVHVPSPPLTPVPPYSWTPRTRAVGSLLLREYEAAIIRRNRSRPEERAFWKPVLTQIEAEVARQLSSLDSINDRSLIIKQEVFLTIYEDALRSYAAKRGLRFVSRNITIPRNASADELRAVANAYLDCGLVSAKPPSISPDGKGNLVSDFHPVIVTYTAPWMVEANTDLSARIDPLVLEQCQIEAIRRGRTKPAERAFWGPVLAQAEADISQRNVSRKDISEMSFYAGHDASFLFHEALASYALSQGLIYRPQGPQAPTKVLPAPQYPPVTIVLSKGTGTVYLAPWYRYLVRRMADGLEVSLNQEFTSWGVHDSNGTLAYLLGSYACYVKYDGTPPRTSAVERKEISPDRFFRAD